MPKTPDYREIDTSISLANLKDLVSSWLYAASIVNDDEDVVNILFDFDGDRYEEDMNIRIKIKLKRNQPIEIIEH